MTTLLAEHETKSDSTPQAKAELEAAPHPYFWTADAFDRACEMGVFGDEARLELIQGRIIDRMGQGSLHSILTTLVAERLRSALSPRFLVREEKPLRIAFDGEPVTDIMVVDRAILDAFQHYAKQQITPEDVLLIVEIAVTSGEYDTGGKALLYAQAGIGDYWVVLAEENAILVHREPTPNGYQQVERLEAADTVSPLAASDVVLAVGDMLGRPQES